MRKLNFISSFIHTVTITQRHSLKHRAHVPSSPFLHTPVVSSVLALTNTQVTRCVPGQMYSDPDTLWRAVHRKGKTELCSKTLNRKSLTQYSVLGSAVALVTDNLTSWWEWPWLSPYSTSWKGSHVIWKKSQTQNTIEQTAAKITTDERQESTVVLRSLPGTQPAPCTKHSKLPPFTRLCAREHEPGL